MKSNQNFDYHNPDSLKATLLAQNSSWMYHPEEENDEHFAFFLFVGKHEGKEVVFDVALYPLHVYYAACAEEQADEEVQQLLPFYKGDESKLSQEQIEEVWERKGELIAEIEADEEFRVKEFIDLVADEDNPSVIVMDVSLNIEEYSDEVIEKFVKDFLNGSVDLDENLYSFSLEEED